MLRHPFKYIYRRSLLRTTKAEAFGRKVRSTPGDNACEHRCPGARRNAWQVTALQEICAIRPELLGWTAMAEHTAWEISLPRPTWTCLQFCWSGVCTIRLTTRACKDYSAQRMDYAQKLAFFFFFPRGDKEYWLLLRNQRHIMVTRKRSYRGKSLASLYERVECSQAPGCPHTKPWNQVRELALKIGKGFRSSTWFSRRDKTRHAYRQMTKANINTALRW